MDILNRLKNFQLLYLETGAASS